MPDLWGLVWGKPWIDPQRLAEALDQNARPGLDHRTRLLVRDSARALERRWGPARWAAWLERSPARPVIEAVRRETLDGTGFPYIEGALMERTEPDTVLQYLRELGAAARKPAELNIGGAIALILPGLIERATQDIDIVDEVPAELREQHGLLDSLNRAYRLNLTHFQSHFLPSGWESRRHSLGTFGPLRAYRVDEMDIFLGKLFSKREKDRDDLRLLLPQLDRAALLRRFAETCGGMWADPALRAAAELNWHILTGEALEEAS
ncbi:MAG: hypothetical protein K2W96_20815 [Gemmataceae bacterium]|nr:hypothetical protein [Gemmataceae bacterium]